MSQSSNNDPQGTQNEDTVEASAQDSASDAVDQAGSDASEQAEAEYSDTASDADDSPAQRSSLAGMALRFLILVLVVFGLAIWALPHIAPRLPDSMAKHLFPTQQIVDQRFAAIESQLGDATGAQAEEVAALSGQVASLQAEIAELKSSLEAAETEAQAARAAAEEAASAAGTATVSEEVLSDAGTAASRAAEAADTATSAATEAGTVASSAMRNTAALSRRVTGFEAQMTALSEEISAISDGLANAGASASGGSTGGGGSPELAAAYNALKARLDGLAAQVGGSGYLTESEAAKFATQDDLRSTRTALAADLASAMDKLPAPEEVATTGLVDDLKTGLSEQLSDLTGRVDSVEQAATSAAESASAAQAEVGGAIRDASLRSAIAALEAQMSTGRSYAAPLNEVARLSEQAPPEALSQSADTGLATPDGLLAQFGNTAREAIAADLRASADGNVLGQATARLRALAAGRPTDAQEGDDVSAVLSRVEVAVSSGDLKGALGEAGTLPDSASGAMAGWLDQLKARVAADAALSEYVAGLGGTNG
ncbi:MAG: COG4223 family protein [Paracoccaceae bacterium]